MPITEEHFGAVTSFSNLFSNEMDGVDEYVDLLPLATFLDNVSAFTFVYWQKVDVAGIVGIDMPFSFRQNPGNNGMEIQSSSIVFLFSVRNGAASFGTFVPPTDFKWIHYAVVFDGTLFGNANRMKVYRDGVLQVLAFTGTIPAITSSVFNTTQIGARDAGFLFKGKMAHPAFFDKALDIIEVNEVVNKKMDDLRTTTVGGNIISAYYFPNGIADYPTWVDYVGVTDGTMINQENTDINVDVPV